MFPTKISHSVVSFRCALPGACFTFFALRLNHCHELGHYIFAATPPGMHPKVIYMNPQTIVRGNAIRIYPKPFDVGVDEFVLRL